MNQKDFIDKVVASNGNRYTVNEDFVSWRQKISVTCNECGQESTPRVDTLIKGRSCTHCNKKKYSKQFTKTTEQYAKEVSDKSNGKYKLDSSYSGVKNKVWITHLECGNTYQVFPYLFNKGRRCPVCKNSVGEIAVRDALDILGVPYIREVTNKTLKGLKHRYSFDFFLPNHGVLIEYQGVQHYKPVDAFGGNKNYQKQIKNDEYKRGYCKSSGYKLLEIPYTITEVNEITEIIKEFLSSDSK